MKAYSYLRFSSKQQADGGSIKRQTELAQRYCLKHDIELDSSSYEDLGVSAYHQHNTDEDAGLGQFLLACSEGKIPKGSLLLVESLDRLSRAKIKPAMRQLMHLTDHVDVVTLQDDKRYTDDMDPLDYMYAVMLAMRAHEESDTKSKRIKAFWDDVRREPTKFRQGRSPYWLNLNNDRQTYTVDESAVDTLKKMFELRLTGMGSSAIAKQLNQLNLKTSKGKNWSPAGVTKMLKSRTLIGEYQPHVMEGSNKIKVGKPFEGYYPEVIEKSKFLKVQALMGTSNRKGSTKTYRNIFLDIAKCKLCGSGMVLTKKKETDYLQCKGARDGVCSCKVVSFKALENWMRHVFISPLHYRNWKDNNSVTEQFEQEKLLLKSEYELKCRARDSLLSMTEQLTDPSVLKKIQELAIEVQKLEKSILEIDQKLILKGSNVSPEATVELINLSFIREDAPENIDARNQLKNLVDKLPSFNVAKIDGDFSQSGVNFSQAFELVVGDYCYRANADMRLKRNAKEALWYMIAH